LSSRRSVALSSSPRRSSSEGMDISLVAPLLLAGIVTTQAVASAAGVSARTINRHLAASGTPRVAAAVLTDTELDSMVAKQIDKLGSNYGARMVIGALRAAHPQSTFSRKRVVASMARHDPMAHAARRIWAQKRIERGAYHAPNFMHSVHLDLACKLQQYKVASVASHGIVATRYLRRFHRS
jgi:hypothetical protein